MLRLASLRAPCPRARFEPAPAPRVEPFNAAPSSMSGRITTRGSPRSRLTQLLAAARDCGGAELSWKRL